MPQTGHLVIIGGAEDRTGDMTILRRFVELMPPTGGPLFVLTAATAEPDSLWDTYRRAFGKLGVAQVEHLDVRHRREANDPASSERVLSARGIFMTGGKQACLVSRVGGTRLGENMRRAYIDNGACIAGTSAGASAVSEHMLWAGDSHSSPTATDFRLVAGLGFVLNAVVDQHFSQRGRMSRLLAVIAYNPKLAGVGIDENTALAIARGEGVEVIGDGAVTLVDGHEIDSRMIDRQDKAVFQVSDVRVHLLPAGAGFVSARVPPARDEAGISAAMRQLVVLLAGCDAVDRQFHDGEARPAPTP